jgi:hypothetical protein
MLAGTFQQKVRRLNSSLRFIACANENRPIGLYRILDNDIEHLCGTDRNDVPEFSSYDGKGHILKSGWRRTVEVLIGRGLVSKNKAEIEFGTTFNKKNTKNVIEEDPIMRAIRQYSSPTKDGIEMRRDDVMDIAREIKKEKSNAC